MSMQQTPLSTCKIKGQLRISEFPSRTKIKMFLVPLPQRHTAVCTPPKKGLQPFFLWYPMLTCPFLGEMGAPDLRTPCNPHMPTLVRNLSKSLRGPSLGHLHPTPVMRIVGHQPMTKSIMLAWQLLALSDLVGYSWSWFSLPIASFSSPLLLFKPPPFSFTPTLWNPPG